MTTVKIVSSILAAVYAGSVAAADWPQWRGPDRDGISKEKGILADWSTPPKKLWQITTSGSGYGAPSVAGGVIYITGSAGTGKARIGTLYALSTVDGKEKWHYEYGPEWSDNYDAARSAPTVADGRVYLISCMGLVVCVNAKDGQKVWSVDTFDRFKGRNIKWGVTESPLLAGKTIICHPGGPDAAVAALDMATGATVWTTKGLGDASAYCSPALLTLNGRKQIVTQTAENVVGIDPETGAVLWKHAHKNQWAVHPNTPVVIGLDKVVVSSGYGYGTECLQIGADGAKVIWALKSPDDQFHGMLLIGKRLYLAASKGPLVCLDPEKGTVLSTIEGASRAAIIGTEAGIIGYTESGKIVLIKLAGDKGDVIGSFPVDFGKLQHWAHLALADGVLYVRHGDGLAAYDVKAK